MLVERVTGICKYASEVLGSADQKPQATRRQIQQPQSILEQRLTLRT